MAGETIANADQLKSWNGATGRKWIAFQADMDRNLGEATAALMPFVVPQPGERILDIGCGAGQTSLLLADAVGAQGRVTGIDISAPLLALARSRATAKNIAFIEADAAFHPFAPAHDLVFSRFGVMFFDDPRAAFANIRKALKPGGRLAFICWRPAVENEWVALPAAAAREFLAPQPPADPLAPGPFAFADAKRIHSILGTAGCRDVRIKKLDGHMDLGPDAAHAALQLTEIGPLSRALSDADDAMRDHVRRAVQAAFEKIATPQGIRPGLACWLVGASA
jgi:SAM-dependent methyltransferase